MSGSRPSPAGALCAALTLPHPAAALAPSKNGGRNADPLQKGNSMQITLPAGEYYVGDPCYSVSHDAEGSEAWDAILTSSNIFDDRIKGSWNGFDVIASRTAYGDGVYTDQNDEYEFGVDAGLIGVIPVALVEHFAGRNSAQALHKVTFDRDFVFESVQRDNDGIITIDHLRISTC